MSWKFWKKDSDDPLLNTFYKKYNLNLLTIPRRDVFPGDLYLNKGYENQQLFLLGKLKDLLKPPIVLPDVTIRSLPEISKSSDKISPNIGLEFLEGFLNIQIGLGFGTRVKEKFEHEDIKSIQFQFNNVTLETMDPFDLANIIKNSRIDPKFISLYPNRHYYLVTTVAHTASIIVAAEVKNSEIINIYFELKNLADGYANISIKEKNGRIIFEGKKVAFGVVLSELKLDDRNEKFILKSTKTYNVLEATGQVRAAMKPSGDAYQGSMFIDINGRRPIDELLDKSRRLSEMQFEYSLLHRHLPNLRKDYLAKISEDLTLKEYTYRVKRFVNVWIEGKFSGQSLFIKREYKLGLNIGYKKIGSIVSEVADAIESLSKKVGRLELMVSMVSQDCKIFPTQNMLVLPASGDSESIYFSVRPERAGKKNEITILLYYKLNLIQVISVPLVVEKTTRSIKSLNQQDKLGLKTKVVLSANDGLNAIINLASRK